jgi:hypothetical protein
VHVTYRPLTAKTLGDVVCCPGGLELQGKTFRGDLTQVTGWRRRMIELGLRGVVAYADGAPRGFAEYMPADVAPVAIEAPGAAVLMCYHWAGAKPDDPEHLTQEGQLLERVIEEAQEEFTGLATQGWDTPTHFPIAFLEGLGLREIIRHDHIALMWTPFKEGIPEPTLASAFYSPQDGSSEGTLAIDAAFSARCPYSIHSETRLKCAVAEHSLRDRIQLNVHRIDSREDAVAYAVPPFDWGWVYLNGEEISLFELSGEKLREEIARRIERLSSST